MRILKMPDNIDKDRFFKFVVKVHCWEWSGSLNKNGYGKFYQSGKLYLAHRISYKIHNVKMSDKLLVDHKCRNRKCVNPDHLRQVDTKTNNIENSKSVSAINKIKTHCKNNHEFTFENTVNRRNGRECRICRNLSSSIRGKKIRMIKRMNREPKIFCKNGHYLEENKEKSIGKKWKCYQCRLDRNRRYYAKKARKLQIQ